MDIDNDDARVINEILTILNDRDVYAQRQMEKNRRIDLDDLFEKIESFKCKKESRYYGTTLVLLL